MKNQKIDLNKKENIVRSGLNYSPNKHLEPCSIEQRKINKTCNNRTACLSEEWENGCSSSHALRDGEHYISIVSPKKIINNRIYFMVTKNPNGLLYFSGLIFIKDSFEYEDSNDRGGISGVPVPFEHGILEWKGHFTGEKWISNKEALSYLKKYFTKVKDEKVKNIIDFFEKGIVSDFLEGYSTAYVKRSQLLKFKKQMIFHGPPGTGKTYKAREFAVNFIENRLKEE